MGISEDFTKFVVDPLGIRDEMRSAIQHGVPFVRGVYPVVTALKSGTTADVSEALDNLDTKFPNVSWRGNALQVALGCASALGRTDAAALLIDRGADPRDPGATQVAIEHGHEETVALLQRRAAEPLASPEVPSRGYAADPDAASPSSAPGPRP